MILFEKMKVCSELTEQYIKNITEKLYENEQFKTHNEYVKDIFDSFSYSLLAGGKRLRPFLVCEFCEMFSGNQTDALSYAAAIEMIHTFSLVHDDLPCMDNDDLRRGKPTNHKVFGEACALLAGDALSIYAFQEIINNKLSDSQNIRAVKLLSQSAGINGMIAGQQLDMATEKKTADKELLTLLQIKKTGCLFECACLLGCIAAGIGEQDEFYLCAKEYARHFGLGFQITDDILDVCGNEAELGKKIGSDKQNGKTTFVTLLGVEKAQIMAKNELEMAKKSLLPLKEKGVDIQALCELCDYVLTRNS